jgi:anaerobic magnesium-protoporphyrin IX monomethyl ester cyclase
MTEVLLGQSYYLRFDPKLWEARQPYPPLGTMYAASYLRERGYDVALFDAMLAESEAAWGDALDRAGARFAVIYEDNFNYLSKMCLLRMRHAAFSMIRMARERDCTVIVAGPDASDHADTYLAHGADFVLIGEGDHTLAELLDGLTGRNDRPYRSISGLAFSEIDAAVGSPSRESRIHYTPPRPHIENLDTLPFPAWDLVDVARYKEIWYRHHGYYSMNVVTTRGCPYHCNWCAKPIWGQHYSVRSPENVLTEIQWLRETYQPDHIWFVDDIFGLEPGWMSRFADLSKTREVRVPFKCLNRPDLLLRDGEIEALRGAGCQIVWLGAESGSQRILDAMEKGTRVEQIYQAASQLQSAGIKTGFFLQFGYLGETRADIERTLQMVRDCQPDDIGISVSYPLPGTKFYDQVKDQMNSRENWHDSDDLAMLYRGPFTTAFYRQLHRVLHKEFRATTYWAEIKRLLRQPGDLEAGHLRQAVAMVYHALTLPLARWRLAELERRPHEGSSQLPRELDPMAAAIPRPRTERGGG